MSEIKAIFPEHIYCTQQIDKETKDKRHIYNDFSIIIEITGCTKAKERGKKASTIHIYGLEKLFLTDGQKSIDKTMAQFAALLQAVDNPQWNVSYNTNSKSIDITCTARKLDEYSIVKFQLSEQCEFTADLSNNDHIDLIVTSENFNLFSPDLDESKQLNYTIWAQQVAYIDKFAAYEYNPQEQNKENEPQEVKAIHKGDWASIQWDLGNLDHYTASLLDENGETKTNVSPYIVQIDKDRKFTLKVKKDNTIETQSLNVYRTLWKKVAEGKCPDGFTPDPKGNNKFFYNNGRYYVYIHPWIWFSKDLIEWQKFAENKSAPQKFNSYSCNYSYSYEEVSITYACDNGIFLNEYHFRADDKNKWTNQIRITNQKSLLSQSIKKNNITISFTVDEYLISIYTVNNNHLQIQKTFLLPECSEAISIDALSLPNDEIIFAILCNNKRLYTYNYQLRSDNKNLVYLYENADKNDIFDFEDKNQNKTFILNTHLIYIVLDKYVFCTNNSEKYMDMHFSPLDSITKESDQKKIIIGEKDSFTFSAIILKEKKLCIWNYKF